MNSQNREPAGATRSGKNTGGQFASKQVSSADISVTIDTDKISAPDVDAVAFAQYADDVWDD